MGNFVAGDVVTLKSGGEQMTINKDNSDGTYQCIWQTGGITKSENFSEAVLSKYEPAVIWGSRPKRNNYY